MRSKRNFGVLVLVLGLSLLIGVILPVSAYAEERAIYAGDIITLEISSAAGTEEALRQKFQDFEILELKKTAAGYRLSLRTFETGEYTVTLGDKALVIAVASALEDFRQEGLYEGEIYVMTQGFNVYWRVLMGITAGVFALSGTFMLAKRLGQRKVKPETPYGLFLRLTGALAEADDNYLVDLTFHFKNYLGHIGNRRIIGKTSAEMVRELNDIPALTPFLADIGGWLSECDRLKFTGITATGEEKRRHYVCLLNLADKINATQDTIKVTIK